MTAYPMQFARTRLTGQEQSAKPLAIALPCAGLALMLLAGTVQAQAPRGPKCEELAPSTPGFESLAAQPKPDCIRIRI